MSWMHKIQISAGMPCGSTGMLYMEEGRCGVSWSFNVLGGARLASFLGNKSRSTCQRRSWSVMCRNAQLLHHAFLNRILLIFPSLHLCEESTWITPCLPPSMALDTIHTPSCRNLPSFWRRFLRTMTTYITILGWRKRTKAQRKSRRKRISCRVPLRSVLEDEVLIKRGRTNVSESTTTPTSPPRDLLARVVDSFIEQTGLLHSTAPLTKHIPLLAIRRPSTPLPQHTLFQTSLHCGRPTIPRL